MRLSVNYFDLNTSTLVGSAEIFPDAGGTYKLPLLAGESATRLRLMRVDDATPALHRDERTFQIPEDKTTSVALHVPLSWKEAYLSVALDQDPQRTPKHAVVVIVTPEPLTCAEDMIAQANARNNHLLCFRYVRTNTAPALPTAAPATKAKEAA